jgi:hypothetical protein
MNISLTLLKNFIENKLSIVISAITHSNQFLIPPNYDVPSLEFTYLSSSSELILSILDLFQSVTSQGFNKPTKE